VLLVFVGSPGQPQGRRRYVSRWRKRDIHLIKLKGILLARLIGRHHLVAIQHIGDEGEPFGLRNELCPFRRKLPSQKRATQGAI
jgi:hypothetical protein